ncbi:MAG: nucleotide exchange factor GrpE [Opitutae bacterium]|nr:nucleotide exchange factor GrpE [Opitutae bacterium]
MEQEENIPNPENQDPVETDAPEAELSEEEKEESVGRLKSKLDDAYGKQDDLKSKYLRAVADLENIRKRSIREREDAVQRTRSQIISDLLPVMDAFQLGFAEAKKHEQTSNFVEGFSMAMTLMETTLSEYGLKVIEPTGEAFDAKLHEAIGYEENNDCEEGNVITTVRTGYRIGERLLRPASVILAKASSTDGEAD